MTKKEKENLKNPANNSKLLLIVFGLSIVIACTINLYVYHTLNQVEKS